MYVLVGFLAVTGTHALLAALERGGARRWALYVLPTVLMPYAHPQGMMFVFGLGVAGLLASLFGRPRAGALRAFLATHLVLAALVAPYVVAYLWRGILSDDFPGLWQPHVSWTGIAQIATVWTPGAPLWAPPRTYVWGPNQPGVPWHAWGPIPLALPAIFAALACRARARRASGSITTTSSPTSSPTTSSPTAPDDGPCRPVPTILHLVTLHAGVGFFVCVALLKPVWHVRYLLAFLPLFLLGLSLGILALRRPWVRALAVLVAAGLSVPGIVLEKREIARTDWRGAAQFLTERGGPRATVFLVGPGYLGKALERYYRGPFDKVPKTTTLVEDALRAAATGRPVFLVYCGMHSPPDPELNTARALAQRLPMRAAARLRALAVYEFGTTASASPNAKAKAQAR